MVAYLDHRFVAHTYTAPLSRCPLLFPPRVVSQLLAEIDGLRESSEGPGVEGSTGAGASGLPDVFLVGKWSELGGPQTSLARSGNSLCRKGGRSTLFNPKMRCRSSVP